MQLGESQTRFLEVMAFETAFNPQVESSESGGEELANGT